MWSQVLTPEETKIWSSCASRDISHDISLKNGIRTPKIIIDEAIKKYKVKSDQEKYDLLSRPISQPFETSDPQPSESMPPDNPDLPDPRVIIPQELVISENMVADSSAPDSLHTGELSLSDPDGVTPPVQMPEPRNLQSGQGYSEHLLQISQNIVIEIRKLKPLKLITIFQRNKQLLFDFMYVLKHKYYLSPRLNRFFHCFSKKKMNVRILKTLCVALISRGFIPKDWMQKPQVNAECKLAGSGLMINVIVNKIKATAILDTGSTFSLIPHAVWLELNLNPNKLDQTVKYNINSASHKNENAVLGTTKLSFAIKDIKGIWQCIEHKCLILRPSLQLAHILLGDDFLLANNGLLAFTSMRQATLNGQIIPLLCNQNASTSYLINSFFSSNQQHVEPAPDIPAVSINSYPVDIQPIPPHATCQPSQQCDDDPSPSTPSLHDPPRTSPASNVTRARLISVQSACGAPETSPAWHDGPSEYEYHEITDVTAHLAACKFAKTKFHANLGTINAYAVQPLSTADFIKEEQEKKDIIPDQGNSAPTAKLSHLTPFLQEEMQKVLNQYPNLFSRSKHHLGAFRGFQAVVEIDKNSKLHCRQAPRNRVLPSSCKQDLVKYMDSGLFQHSTGLADDYCANITLVLRNQIKEGKDTTKATKNLQKQALKSQKAPKTRTLQPEQKTQLRTEPLDPATPDSQRSLYRMTLDFRLLNRKTLNEKTSQLPSIQSIESKFFDSYVTTMDLANCYPSIIVHKDSRNFFNFFCESQIWNCSRLPQGWSPSLAIAQRAVLWTFRDAALHAFLKQKGLPANKFPFQHFHQFVQGFVDDLALHSSRTLKDAQLTHILCIEAVFFALETAGWLVKLEVCTFMDPHFVFLGLFWNLNEGSSIVQNDRVAAILNHRTPRSLPELASRLATIQYYASHLPLMKRISIPLYKILKTGQFQWTQVHCHAYGNLLFLMALQIRNTIFNPNMPICAYADTSMLETGLLLFQWDPQKLGLNLIHTKSILLPTAIRNQASVHRECFGISALLTLAKPYFFQSTAKANFLFNDASCIGYISRAKHFSSFLQSLAEELSMHPTLVVIHLPGRALWFADVLSREYDHVLVPRGNSLSKDQALLVPALREISPGAILTNEQLKVMFARDYDQEILDVSDSDCRYVQRIDWSLYNNPNQFFSSEREYLLGALIGKLDPELSLRLPTLQDIFRVKETGNKLKTKLQKVQFIKQISENLSQLPYDSRQLQKLTDFLKSKADEYKIPSSSVQVLSNCAVIPPSSCLCAECEQLHSLKISNTLSGAEKVYVALQPILALLNIEKITTLAAQYSVLTCTHAKEKMCSFIIDTAIEYCVNSDNFHLSGEPLLIFKYYSLNQEVVVHFNGNRLQFCLSNQVEILPGQISQFNVAFFSDLQIVPTIESDLSESLAIAPQISFDPQLTMDQLNLANCSSKSIILPANSVLLEFSFPTKQIVGVFRSLHSIKSSFK